MFLQFCAKVLQQRAESIQCPECKAVTRASILCPTCTSSHLGQKAWSSRHRVTAKHASNTFISVVASSFSYCKFLVLGKCHFSLKHHLGKVLISIIYQPGTCCKYHNKNSKGINRKLQVLHQLNIRLLGRVFAHLITEAFASLNKELAPTANGKGQTWYNSKGDLSLLNYQWNAL